MTNSLFITTSVTNVIFSKIQVTQSLIDFYKFYKHQHFELVDIIERLESLAKTFQHFEKVLSKRTFQANEQNLIKSIEKLIIHCKKLIQKLQNKCEKFNKISLSEIKTAVKIAKRRATYSFRQNTLQKLNENITKMQVSFFVALNVLQLNDIRRFQKDFIEMKALLNFEVASNQSNLIRFS